jgi:hypothetical protein
MAKFIDNQGNNIPVNPAPNLGVVNGGNAVPNGSVGTQGFNVASQVSRAAMFPIDSRNSLQSIFQLAKTDSGLMADMLLEDGETKNFKYLIDKTGMKKPVSTEVIYATTLAPLDYRVIFSSTPPTPTGPGNAITLTLSSGAMVSSTTNLTTNAVNYASFVEVGETILFGGMNSARVESKDTTVNPHKITVKPLRVAFDVGAAIAATIAAGNVPAYTVNGSAMYEGGGSTKSRTPRLGRYSNTFQIFSKKIQSTHSEMTNEIAFFGTSINMMRKHVEKEFYQMQSNALLTAQQTDNPALFETNLGVDGDVAIYTMEGYLPFVYTRAFQQGRNTSAAFTLQGLDPICHKIKSERVGVSEFVSLMGNKCYTNIENSFLNYFNSTNSPYLSAAGMVDSPISQMGYGTDGFKALVGFKEFQKNDIKFKFCGISDFDHARGLGASGYSGADDLGETAIFTPMTLVTDTHTNTRVPMLGICYKQLGDLNREYTVDELPGSGTGSHKAVREEDYTTTIYKSEISLRCLGARKTFALRPQ